jgi:hypothetical protein
MRALSGPRVMLALALAALAALGSSAACRKKPVEPKFSNDPMLSEISKPFPTIPDLHLNAPTPDSHGLVASILTPHAARTPSSVLDGWVPLVPTPGQIVWIGDMATGYEEAVRQKKAMVVVMGETGPQHLRCVQMFGDSHLLALADQAVFIGVNPVKDVVAKNIATVLGIEHLPMIVILDPDPDIISEEMMIQGCGDPESLARQLREPILRANGKLPKVPTMKPGP